jgi:radical SAM superfamily enzyme YgiQ (UPF0313 family)
MPRLLLISPVALNSWVGKDFHFKMPVLGLLKIAALTPEPWSVSIVDEKVEPLDLNADADLVGITAMTSTAVRAYEIADHFRSRGMSVVMGGQHISVLPEEGLTHCDSVLVGEAEGLWTILLQDYLNGALQKLYRHDGERPSLENQPLANWDLYRGKGYLPAFFLETTRGCPFDCEFCAVTTAFGGKFRSRPIEDVMEELRRLDLLQGRHRLDNCVFFVDDNIFSNRSYARELLTQVADLNINWFSHSSMNIAKDPEMLALCQKSGCGGLLIGFETLSSETMRSIGKKPNRPNDYLEMVQRIHDYGIGIDASFVFGFDTEDDSAVQRTVDFVHRAKIEVPYYSILTPYPGTRLYRRMAEENRILTRDWSLYDTSHVVFKPRLLTPEQLLDGYFCALKDSYSLSSIVRRLWGANSWKTFFAGMNYGFRRSVRAMRDHASMFRNNIAEAART